MTTARVTRTRRLPPLKKEFEINFKLEIMGPGITDEEAASYVKELLRYASAALAFKVRHPIQNRDAHGRDRHNTWGGADKVNVS